MPRIRISWRTGEVIANLRDSPSTEKLLSALPCSATARTWGEEVYFEVPISIELEPGAEQVVEPGTVCFWVDGSAVALPFGPTPISKAGECRLVTPCNVLGRIAGDARRLKDVRDGDTITIASL